MQALWSAVYYVARGGDTTPGLSDGYEDEMDADPLALPCADGQDVAAADARSAGSLV